ncbi:MAG: ImmA/IrrE family metallo-endopeptidase [Spirochaetales bacterium]|nr:ImmA/IrrE family metallo-endopeptidase [Spirochaetales bacterium]
MHSTSGIHVDKKTFFRNNKSTDGLDMVKIEANRFAAELLMPRNYIDEYMYHFVDFIDSDTDTIDELARRCDVSKTAMSIRLQTIKNNTASI